MARPFQVALLVVAWSVGILYIYAGMVKLIHPDRLLQDILGYEILSYESAIFAAYLLPAAELVAGAAIFIRRFRVEASWILLMLTFIFTGALITAWMRGLDVSCGCFGHSSAKANYPLLVMRDVAIALGCSFVLLGTLRNSSENGAQV